MSSNCKNVSRYLLQSGSDFFKGVLGVVLKGSAPQLGERLVLGIKRLQAEGQSHGSDLKK